MIAAVNESIWEHLKLVFWPGLLFPLFENNFLKEWVANFWIAKLFSLLIMPLVIALGWYGVVAIIRKIVYKFHLPFMEHIDSLAIIIT